MYVGNLPRMDGQPATDAAMQDLFGSVGLTPTAVSKMISPHPSKASEPGNHYYCFVDLANNDEVQVAINELNGREVEDWGAIKVNRARDNRDRKVNRDRQQDYQPRSGGARGEERGAWRGEAE